MKYRLNLQGPELGLHNKIDLSHLQSMEAQTLQMNAKTNQVGQEIRMINCRYIGSLLIIYYSFLSYFYNIVCINTF